MNNNHCFHFSILTRDDKSRIRLAGTSTEVVEDAFEFEWSPDSQFGDKITNIEENVCTFDDVRFVGQQLWLGLLSRGLRDAFQNDRLQYDRGTFFQIRLSVPGNLRRLPWEALYDETVGSLAVDPKYCIVHDPPEKANIAAFESRSGDGLEMLIIVSSGFALNAELELNNLRREAKRRSVSVTVLGEDSPATPDAIHEALAGSTWDIVHYVGHGRLTEKNRTEVLVASEAGGAHWLDAEIFASDFSQSNVRLSVMNCCYSAGSGERPDSLDGLGPLLMRGGVPAVVAMRYPIADNMAIRFSNVLYRALFNGSTPGRIDLAVQLARGALMRNQTPSSVRSFITPVLHLARGYEQLFNIVAPPKEALRDVHEIRVTGFMLDEKLRDALRKRRCIPVVGPGILRLGAFRSDPPPGMFELAVELALQRNPPYPYPDHIEICRRLGDRMSGQLFQWICQVYQKDGGLPAVIELISKRYGLCEPPEIIKQLANWEVPGMFYTYFDGLLERCIERPDRRIFCRIDQFSAAATSERPLILLRGSLNDQNSLVLTETDHVRLLAAIMGMRPEVGALTRQLRRNVIFIGVNPGDPLVRQLSHKLLERGGRLQETPFFACTPQERNAVDEAFWSEYEVRWIDGDLEAILNTILEVAK